MSNSVLKFGAQWLGQLPDGWDQLRARYLFTERKEKSTKNDTHLTPSQKYAVLPQDEYMKRTGNRVVLNLTGSDNMKHVEEGDFVIHLRSFQGGIEYSGYTGKVSNAYTVLEPKDNVDSGFLKHVLKSHGFISELSRTTDQLRDGQSIKFSQLDLLEFPSPKPITQQKIADFLDQETAKIDNLIAKQERLLELLEEKRRATITHAVTRGLNPHAELKQTNIPWLGEIPAHWELTKLKSTISSQKNGVWGSDPDGGENDINCIRVADFDRDNLTVSEAKFTKRSIQKKDLHGRLLKNGDLLFEKSGGGDNQLVGQIVKYDLDQPAVTSNFVSKLTVIHGNNADFLVYLHAALYYQRVNYRSIKQTSGIQNIDSTAYFSEVVGLPNEEEQANIAKYINKELGKIRALKQKIQTQITLLRERRTSLISHAVTGKVKV